MRALKIAGAAVAALIAIVALLLVIGIPSGFITSAIQDRVERETGYRLTISGATRIGVWPSLHVTLNDIALQNPRDRDNSDRLTVGRVEADIVGVRSAVCRGGDRGASLDVELVAAAVAELRAVAVSQA